MLKIFLVRLCSVITFYYINNLVAFQDSLPTANKEYGASVGSSISRGCSKDDCSIDDRHPNAAQFTYFRKKKNEKKRSGYIQCTSSSARILKLQSEKVKGEECPKEFSKPGNARTSAAVPKKRRLNRGHTESPDTDKSRQTLVPGVLSDSKVSRKGCLIGQKTTRGSDRVQGMTF